GSVPDRGRLRHQCVWRCAARSARSAHARLAIISESNGREVMKHFRTALLAAASIAATLAFTSPGSAQSEQPPKAGGTLEIGTVYVTLSALSWDNADW